jgi:hypothetical protein
MKKTVFSTGITLAVVLLVLACAAVLAGCGGGSGGSSGAVKNPRGAAPSTDFSFDLTEDGAGVVITGYSGKGGKVVIPAAIEDVPVVEIRVRAFRENYDITELVVPDSVITIGAAAFAGMGSLTAVTLPDGLKKIPAVLFSQSIAYFKSSDVIHREEYPCGPLTTINLPAGLESVGADAFAHAGELVNLTIPDSLTGVAFENNYVFSGCGKLPLKTRQRLKDLGYTGSF